MSHKKILLGCAFLLILLMQPWGHFLLVVVNSNRAKCDGQFVCRIFRNYHEECIECVPPCKVCNGINDCTNGRDEMNCPASCSEKKKHRCRDSVTCATLCDGEPECPDKEDETLCAQVCTCKAGEYKCCTGNTCITIDQMGDGIKQCSNGEDEQNLRRGCGPGQYTCSGKGRVCIAAAQICDGVKDCPQNDDESRCMASCDVGEFRCISGECLSGNRVCDGLAQCPGQEDEDNCPCPEGKLRCSGPRTRCIPWSAQCNGFKDCPNGEDEGPKCGCPNGFARCHSGYCIRDVNVCNGFPDCPGGEDEQHCRKDISYQITPAIIVKGFPCTNGQYRCNSGACVETNRVCDGTNDCLGGDDEQNCPPQCFCSNGQYICSNGECIDGAQFCDGVPTCPDPIPTRC